MERTYELKLADTPGTTRGTHPRPAPVLWDGTDGPNAAQRYADTHPGAIVVAWQDYPRTGLLFGLKPIIA